MRVRCTNIVNPATGLPEADSSWLEVGGEYVVASITFTAGRPASLRILARDLDTPGIWPAGMFVTTDDRIPSTWVIRLRDDDVLELGPSTWLAAGFWESYFNDDDAALAVYQQELRAILDESLPSSR